MIDPVPLPAGVRDVLPVEAAELRALGDALAGAFSAFGYREVMTPLIELADVLDRAEEDGVGRAYRLFDDEGRVLVLRPDLTVAYTDTDGDGSRGDRRPPGAEKYYSRIDEAIETLWREAPGDVLVFLPGRPEIRRAARALERRRIGGDGIEAQDAAGLGAAGVRALDRDAIDVMLAAADVVTRAVAEMSRQLDGLDPGRSIPLPVAAVIGRVHAVLASPAGESAADSARDFVAAPSVPAASLPPAMMP
jgi:hypothetical protein